jgi:hypothetical protein
VLELFWRGQRKQRKTSVALVGFHPNAAGALYCFTVSVSIRSHKELLLRLLLQNRKVESQQVLPLHAPHAADSSLVLPVLYFVSSP